MRIFASKEFLDEANRSGEGGGSDIGAEPGIVEDNLLRWVNRRVGVIPGNPVHLVDIRYPLLRALAAVLACRIGEDDYIHL